MKYLKTLLILFIGLSLSAQKVSYEDGMILQDGEEVETIDVILSPKVETIKDKFEDWMDENYDVDLDGKKLIFWNKEFMTANGVVIPQISDKKIDLKVKVAETTDGNSKLHVFASYGYNNWITPADHPHAHTTLRNIVFDFVADYLPEYYYEKVEDSKERLADLRDDRSDLKDDLDDNLKELEKLEKVNRDLRLQLKNNEYQIETTEKKISERKKDYKMVKNRVSDIKK